jgi:hypothetical protein
MVVIQTPVSSKSFTQVTCLMTDEEFEAAKLERPDLIFKLASELPVEDKVKQVVVPEEDETKGITVRGMTIPHDIDNLINQLFEKE